MKKFLYKIIVCLYNWSVLDIFTAFNNTTNKPSKIKFICCVIFFCWMLLELLVSLIIFFIFFIWLYLSVIAYFNLSVTKLCKFYRILWTNNDKFFEEREEKPWIYQIVEEKICSYIDIWIFLGNDYIYLYYMINSIFYV